MAGIQGFEPRQTDPETGVLPLDDIPLIKWLGRQDSNLRMTEPKPVALPLGDYPTESITAWRRGRDSNPR